MFTDRARLAERPQLDVVDIVVTLASPRIAAHPTRVADDELAYPEPDPHR
jgi:hypothetical protein